MYIEHSSVLESTCIFNTLVNFFSHAVGIIIFMSLIHQRVLVSADYRFTSYVHTCMHICSSSKYVLRRNAIGLQNA